MSEVISPSVSSVRAPTVGFVSLGCPKALTDSELILTQLSADLMNEFPGVSGFSKRNLEQMRRWVTFWSQLPPIAKQPASQWMDWAGTEIRIRQKLGGQGHEF